MTKLLIRIGSAKSLTLGPGATVAEALVPRHFEPG